MRRLRPFAELGLQALARIDSEDPPLSAGQSSVTGLEAGFSRASSPKPTPSRT